MKANLLAAVSTSLAMLASQPALAEVTVTPIGSPIWMPVDFHQFAAPIGSGIDHYLEEFTLQGKILSPPNHVPNPALGIGQLGVGFKDIG